MPDAVPRRYEIVSVREVPLANIRMMKEDSGVSHAGQTDHFCGNVQSLHFEVICKQQINNPSAGTAPYIYRRSLALDEFQCPGVLVDSVFAIKMFTVPPGSEPVIIIGGFLRIHAVNQGKETQDRWKKNSALKSTAAP